MPLIATLNAGDVDSGAAISIVADAEVGPMRVRVWKGILVPTKMMEIDQKRYDFYIFCLDTVLKET